MRVIQRLRERAGISRSRLSLISGVNLTTLYEFEVGRRQPYPKAARQLAEALGWEGDPMRMFDEAGEVENA